jgi:PAS domain-containing protein
MFSICGFDPENGPPSYSTVIARIHAEDARLVDQRVQAALLAGQAFQGEYRLPMPDGTEKSILYLGHPVPGEGGEGPDFVGVVMDLSEHRKAQEATKALLDQIRCLTARLLEGPAHHRDKLVAELRNLTS